MKHNASTRARLARTWLGLACVALAPSCTAAPTSDDPGYPAPDAAAASAVDPTGNWDLTYSYGAGCSLPAGSTTATFTITRTPDSFAVTAAGVTTTGTLICTPASCKLSGMFDWTAAGAQYQQNANLALDPHGAISGNGTESVVTPATGTTTATTCSFAFTVQGTRI